MFNGSTQATGTYWEYLIDTFPQSSSTVLIDSLQVCRTVTFPSIHSIRCRKSNFEMQTNFEGAYSAKDLVEFYQEYSYLNVSHCTIVRLELTSVRIYPKTTSWEWNMSLCLKRFYCIKITGSHSRYSLSLSSFRGRRHMS